MSTKTKKPIASHTLKSLMRPIPFAMVLDVERVKNRQKMMMIPIFRAKEFSMPSKLLASSPITGVPMPTVVIIAMK